jgi:hypothetical protein
MSYPTFILSYAVWKAKRTALAGITYYLEHGRSYVAIVISQTAERIEVYRADIIKDDADPNLTDFETNIKPTAVKKTSIEDIMAEELLASSGGHEPLVSVAFGSVPAAYGAGAELVTTGFRNILQVRNKTNQEIFITLDGTTDHFYLEAGEVGDYKGISLSVGATVRIKYDSVAPTSGSVLLSAWSGV